MLRVDALGFSQLHQPIAAFRRANKSITPLESDWFFIACLNSAAERTAFLSTCMTSMPPRMPAWAARPSGSTSLIERPLESLVAESLDIGLRQVRDLDPQFVDR